MNAFNRLDTLTDSDNVSSRLTAAGFDAREAQAKAALFAASARSLADAGTADTAAVPVRAVHAFFVPGRIEVLGKHTDYAGGRSLIATAERGFCLIAATRPDATVRIFDAAGQDGAEFAISPDLSPAAGHWSNYPMTVARRLARNFPGAFHGADIAFAGDLPPAAGMSSSSALIVAVYLALAAVNRLAERGEYRENIDSPETLAGYLATIENGRSFGSLAGDKGVGTFGGSEDHTAILCCKAGRLSQYSYCPVRLERTVKLPEGFTFAVASSGVMAEKTGRAREKYNRASQLASAVAAAWRRATGRDETHIAAALAGEKSAEAAARMREILSAHTTGEFTMKQLLDRFEHFFAESEQILPAAGDALAAGDVETFGELVDRSQEIADSLLGNQVPETIFLARSARRLGAEAASAFGAGFGGSVWAMVRTETAEKLLEDWAGRYKEKFPTPAARSRFFLTRPGPAAFEL